MIDVTPTDSKDNIDDNIDPSTGLIEISDDKACSVIDEIKKYCTANGVTFELMYKTLADGLQAEKITIDKYGDEHVEPDHLTRHKYLLTALELLQHIKSKDIANAGNTTNYTQIVVNPQALDERIAILYKAQERDRLSKVIVDEVKLNDK